MLAVRGKRMKWSPQIMLNTYADQQKDYHIVALFQLSTTRVCCVDYSFKFRYILAFSACIWNMW